MNVDCIKVHSVVIPAPNPRVSPLARPKAFGDTLDGFWMAKSLWVSLHGSLWLVETHETKNTGHFGLVSTMHSFGVGFQ